MGRNEESVPKGYKFRKYFLGGVNMIFVTVGTHEQQFDRLVKKIDDLKEKEFIKDEVIVQYGFCNYIPKHCISYKLLSYADMKKFTYDARIVITHGGPASFIEPIIMGKIPIVVPRQKEYNEHVNNHQMDFVKQVANRHKNIIPVYDIEDIKEKIINYDAIIEHMKENYKSNNKEFVSKLETEIKDLF